MSEIDYVCARWRDAITDPPPDGWTGLGVTDLDGDECHAYVDDPRYYRGLLIRWLDVTDIPAVPRAEVRAAVDEMVSRYWHGVNCIINGDSSQCEECAFDKYPLPLCKSLACIEHFTGITPTVKP